MHLDSFGPENTHAIKRLLPDWLEHLRDRDFSAGTITRYSDHLTDLLRTHGETMLLTDLATSAIDVHTHNMRERGCQGSTRNNAVTAIRSFCRWCVKRGYLTSDPTQEAVRPIKGDPNVHFLGEEDIQTMLDVLVLPSGLTPHEQFHWRRARLAVFIMLYAGLRLSEVASLRWGSVDMRGRVISIVRSKHKRNRIVRIVDDLFAELSTVEPKDRVGPVIFCWKIQEGKRAKTELQPKTVAHIFERWLAKRLTERNGGLTAEDQLRVRPHMLRRAYATRLFRDSRNLDLVRLRLGHKRLDTTQLYLAGNYDDEGDR